MTGGKASARARRIHSSRHGKTVARVGEAVSALESHGKTITFAAVARASGVGRSTLYGSDDIRSVVENAIGRQRTERVADSLAAPDGKDAMITSLSRRIERLERENGKLRERLNAMHADSYHSL